MPMKIEIRSMPNECIGKRINMSIDRVHFNGHLCVGL